MTLKNTAYTKIVLLWKELQLLYDEASQIWKWHVYIFFTALLYFFTFYCNLTKELASGKGFIRNDFY